MMAGAARRPLAYVTDYEPDSRSHSLLASALNLMSCGPEPRAWHSSLRVCTKVLASGGTVLIESGQPSCDRANTAFALACDAWASAFPGKLPVVLPIQIFYPAARRRDTMVHVGGKLSPDRQRDHPGNGAGPQSSRTLQEACCNCVFALDDGVLAELRGDLEQALRDRLTEQWQTRRAWNQNASGFRLSLCAAESLSKINREEPATLVAFRDLSESSREARRQWSLARFRAELGRKQLSFLRRFWGWTESAAGLPVACYGLLNHLTAAILLRVCGLTRRDQSSKREPWLARTLVVLSCYAGQIALVNGLAGRAAAGYYALTLPASGSYLLRYRWLLRKRTGVLLMQMRLASLRRLETATRKKFFEHLDRLFVGGVKTPRSPSPEQKASTPLPPAAEEHPEDADGRQR